MTCFIESEDKYECNKAKNNKHYDVSLWRGYNNPCLLAEPSITEMCVLLCMCVCVVSLLLLSIVIFDD